MPSVRGRQRSKVVTALIGSCLFSGAAVGAVAGVGLLPARALLDPLFSSSGDSRSTAITAIVVAGVALDLAALATGRPAPPAIGRQVPREWIDCFSPTVVAVLFGARLGVGPATILSTWTWWSVTVAAGLVGLGEAVAVGASFGLARAVVTVFGSLIIEAGDAGSVMTRFRAVRRPGWAALNGAVLVAVLAALSVGCSGSTGNAAARSELPAGDGVGDAAPTAENPPLTIPARLEDIVRSVPSPSTTPGADGPGQETSPSFAAAPAEAMIGDDSDVGPASGASRSVLLRDDLPSKIAGFELIAGQATDRFLDLQAAAELQPDPIEEVALLETRGFRGGWTRAFRNDGNDVAVASVYEFADAAQAEFYLEDGLITIGGYGGSFFDIEGLPGVRGFAQTFDDTGEELLSLGAAFQTGSRWYLVYLVGQPDSITPDVLLPVVAQRWEAAGNKLVAPVGSS